MEIRRLGEGIGAQITGIDVRRLTESEFQKVYRAWIDHGVVAVRDQSLSMGEFLAYGRRFGVIRPHPSKSTRHPDCPEITLLGADKRNDDGSLNEAVYRRGAEHWHTDGAYDDPPFKATQLYALAIPSRGGDTLFASGYAAYEALPARLKNRVRGVLADFTYGGRSRKADVLLNPDDRERRPARHPLVRVHPESGRTALYFDPGKILRIEGLPEAESDALIEELTGYMVQPAARYRHRWRVGDVVIWDNRCTYHRAAADYPPEEDRIHWRVSIKEV